MRALALLVLLPAAAGADAFEEARRLSSDELGDLFWSAATACDARGDALLRRQCRALVTARAQAWAGGTYVVRGDGAAALEGGQTVVRSCLACATPVRVAGQELHIVGRGSVGEGSSGLLAPELARVEGAPGPVDLVFRLPAEPERWTQGTRRGFFVEIVGWRFAAPRAVHEAATPDTPELPDKLSAAQIKAAMTPVATEVERCFESHGVPGTADLGFEVGGDGAVRHAEVRGELADTPTAHCITDAVKKVTFPRFKQKTMWIHYPFTGQSS